jgi:hypothetical protein
VASDAAMYREAVSGTIKVTPALMAGNTFTMHLTNLSAIPCIGDSVIIVRANSQST